MKIAIALCTRRRPEQLEAALRSIAAVTTPPNTEIFAIIVENDVAENSRAIVGRVTNGIAMHYFLEPEAGLSPARNRCLAEALALGADWIVTCDDDCVMDANCISAYVSASARFPATHVFVGRTRYVFPDDVPAWHPRPDATPVETGRRPYVNSTSNSMFSSAVVAETGYNIRFDNAFRFSGAEDTDFFLRARQASGPILWVEEAIVVEDVIPSRTGLGYLFRRQLRNGQNMGRVIFKNYSLTAAVLKLLHAIYRYCLFGIFEILHGTAQLLWDERRGLSRIFAGGEMLTLAAGMAKSFFAKPAEWYRS